MLISNKKASHSPRGFTLIEVVVALAVLSLILLATVSALRTFANTQVSLDRVTGRMDQVRTVSGFLRDTLAAAVPGVRQGGGLSLGGDSSEFSYFEADSNSLAWKASALFGEAYGGTMLMRLVKEEDALMLYWQEPPPAREPVIWQQEKSRVLVQPIEEFQVDFRAEYYLDWQSGSWDAEGAPVLVRLTIKADGRYWPDLIIGVQG